MMTRQGLLLKLATLEKEELRLFGIYNRRARSEVKLEVLNKLIAIINQINIVSELCG